MKNWIGSVLIMLLLAGCSQAPKKFDAKLAWLEFEQVMTDNYAYLATEKVDVKALFSHYQKEAIKTQSRAEFVDLLQVVSRFFVDPHFNIGPLNEFDYSVTPTGSDIWVRKEADGYYIEDLKKDGAAEISGLNINQKITKIDSFTIDEVIQNVYSHTSFPLKEHHKLWAVNIALGGLRNKQRVIEVLDNKGNVKTHNLNASYAAINKLKNGSLVSSKIIDDVGYIRINNSLGNNDTVAEFKAHLLNLVHTKGLIIDLRNTPSGGNTGVAEPILGHFVDQEMTYQLYQSQTSGINYVDTKINRANVSATKPFYHRPYVVLAGRWTGSMGEGMTIGLDALGAKAIIGSPMADLLGGINQFELKAAGAQIELGFERLFHVNGSFREDFVPQLLRIPADVAIGGGDPLIDEALGVLSVH